MEQQNYPVKLCKYYITAKSDCTIAQQISVNNYNEKNQLLL